MGQLNRRAVLMCLQQLGPASRAELAKTLELSQPTVGKIVDELIRLGIVEEVGEPTTGFAPPAGRSKAGRPARLLSLNASTPRFLGIHLDVRETRFARMPVQPRSTDQWDLVLPTATSHAGWSQLLRQARKHLGSLDLLGVILSVPGIVDDSSGRVLFSPNLHWIEKIFLPDTLHEIWPLPIVMIQELQAMALGYRTLDRSDEDFLAVDIGEGVGAAAVVAGRLYSSQLPFSGELGHTPVAGNERTCGCGATGCLETLISRRGLLQSFAAESGLPEPALDALGLRIRQQGIPRWLVQTLDAAGAAMGSALNVMGLRKVVVSGVLNDLPDQVHTQLQAAITRASLWQRFGEISCTLSPRHHTAGMVAAGLDRLVMPATPDAPWVHLPGEARRLTG